MNDLLWKIRKLFCWHSWEFFTEYDEYNDKKDYHYTIYQCKKCNQVKIERRIKD